jgi:pimeloyl-ACP methyl ester carboxylesterase
MWADPARLRIARGLPRYAFLAFLVSCAASPARHESPNLERSVCGFKEALAFWLWSRAAGAPDPSRVTGLPNVEDVALTTLDGRILRGYKLVSTSSQRDADRPRGYLLVAQGNAMLADQIIGRFQAFTRDGYDVYIFDYRGYGRSQGRRRLTAILSDYGEIIDHLDAQGYLERRFYGMSFGGIVLLNALEGKPGRHRLVIDSTPSRLSDYGCPATYDPVNRLPEDGSNVLMITGLQDRVVTPKHSAELLAMAGARGATVIRDAELGHPFMDARTDRRLQSVRSFLSREDSSNH